MKKNKLYTVNKWNQPSFMPKDENIFWTGGQQVNLTPDQMQRLKVQNMSINPGVTVTGSNNAIYQRARNDLSNSIQGNFNPNAIPNISVPTNQGVNAQSQQQIQPQQAGLMDSSLSFLASPYGAMANGIGAVAGKALSGNKKSIFSGWTGGVAQATQGIPVVGGFMSIADGVMNALYGEEQADLDMGKINDIAAKNQQAAQGATTISNTMDYKSFADAINNVNYASTSTRGRDIDNNDTAEGRRIARELNEKAQAANNLIAHNIDFASNNIARNMSNNAAKNFVYAYGGNLFDTGGDMLDSLLTNVDTRSDSTYQGYNPKPIRQNAGAMVGTNPISDLVGALDDVTSTTKNNPYIQMGTAPAPGRAANVAGALKSMVKPSFTKAVSNFKPTTQKNTNVLPIYAYGGNLFAGGGEANEYSTDYNPISDDYTPIISTDYQPLINTLKRDDTKFNVDDFAYRAKKLHPEVTREQVADVYNSTPFIAAGVQGDPTARAKYIEATDNNAGSRVMVYPNAIQADPGIGGNSKIENMRGVMAHDNNHLMFDQVLGGQHTDAEKQYMDAAYPDDVFSVRSNQDAYDEKRATNAQLRSSISRENNNAIGKSLDKIIDKMSDNALMGHYMNQNGYLNKNKIRQNMKKPNGRWDSERTKAIRESLKNVAFMPNNSLDGIQNGMAAFGGPLFALGGDLQTNGGDWSTGLTHIDAGKSHEESPYDGVQVGIDPEGTPNLVEEGETIFDDYVYSNRILADDATKKMFRVPKKRDITYAEISKRLEKEASERPNDPISQAGLKAQMHDLAEQQERQKQEMEAERAKAAFDALSPEEQIAVMNNAAEQEATAQQAAQEQAIAEQQAIQQPTPEEAAMMQQQMADGSNPNLGVEPQMNACGGKINRFDWGGLEELFSNPDAAFTNSLGAGRLPWNTKMRREDVAKLEDEEGYKKWTQYVNDHWDDENVQKYLKALDLRAGGNHLYFPNGSAKDKEKAKAYWNSARTDKKMGYYHYTPTWNEPAPVVKEEPQEAPIYHALEDDDDYIEGELDPNVVGAETRRVILPDNAGTVIYHDRVKPAIPAEEKKEEGPKDKKPKQRAEWLRYAGLLGPAVGLGMQALGIGKPDYSRMDAAVSGAGNAYLADYKPLGDYLTYRPMDIWYEQNRMNANARATDRAIMNNAAPIGTKMAGLLASGYNDQIASGNLYRQALEYNDAQREKVAAFNRGTNQYNSDQYGQTSRFNAQARNQANQFGREMAMRAATERMNRDAGWYNSIYGNVGQLFKGIGDLGTENFRMNRISEMGADGIFGNLGESYTGRRAIEDRENQAAKGGKLKKRKGFTY